MLPNPLRILRLQAKATDERVVTYDLQVPAFVESSKPVYSDGHPVTLEEQLVAIVQGNCARARVALTKPGDSFGVVFKLLNTHLVPPLVVNLGYLCNTLAPALLHRRLHLPSDALGVTVDQRAASSEHNLPALVQVRLERDAVHD